MTGAGVANKATKFGKLRIQMADDALPKPEPKEIDESSRCNSNISRKIPS